MNDTEEILAAMYDWRKLRVRLQRIFGRMPGTFGAARWFELSGQMDQAMEWTERDAIQKDRLEPERPPQ